MMDDVVPVEDTVPLEDAVSIDLDVNGQHHQMEVEPRLLLIHLLRDVLGLTGSNVGCDTTACGACTVLLDGEAVKSCTVLAVQASGHDVTTIEGLSATGDPMHPMQQAFHECHALQCGYCTPGMVMAAISLTRENPTLTKQEVRDGLKGNLCRCTGYQNIVSAVLQGAEATRLIPVTAARAEADPAPAPGQPSGQEG